jgi:hypothetical protein
MMKIHKTNGTLSNWTVRLIGVLLVLYSSWLVLGVTRSILWITFYPNDLHIETGGLFTIVLLTLVLLFHVLLLLGGIRLGLLKIEAVSPVRKLLFWLQGSILFSIWGSHVLFKSLSMSFLRNTQTIIFVIILWLFSVALRLWSQQITREDTRD